jgi:hypothetical protein
VERDCDDEEDEDAAGAADETALALVQATRATLFT